VDADRLRTLPLFSSLSDRELRDVARLADEVEVEAGRHLIDEGRFAYEFFVIEEGDAEVTRGGERINALGPGDFFGELALLEAGRRTATVTTTEPSRLLVLFDDDFTRLRSRHPGVAGELEAAARRRLSDAG
jgi:CRP-like cAMP-binding protein